MSPSLATMTEYRETFACFGSQCTVIVTGGPDAAAALGAARQRLLGWHSQFSRFEPASELSLLNADARETVPVSPLMRRILQAALAAAQDTGGLVDPTLGTQIERAGYAEHLEGPALDARRMLELAPARHPAGPDPAAHWREVSVDRRTSSVTRPPGLRIDPGGIAKGVFADELGTMLSNHDAFVVDCAGDLRLGGRGAIVREVHVASPFGDDVLHTFELSDGAAATSGIGARNWLMPDGTPGHHLLDPSTGRPAFTGIVQATALAPTATQAEGLSKLAALSGRDTAHRRLRYGGVLVLDSGRVEIVKPRD